MNTRELGERLSRVNMPNMDGYVAFIFWSLFVTGEDPRYAKSERLEELWARWNIEAPDAVRSLVEKYERDIKEKEKHQQLEPLQRLAQTQNIYRTNTQNIAPNSWGEYLGRVLP